MLQKEFRPLEPGWYVFQSEVGPVALIWTRRGISGVEFGSPSRENLIAVVAKTHPDLRRLRQAPAPVAEVARRLKALLRGNPDDLRDVPVDLGRSTEFTGKVLHALRKVRPGTTVTYGELATRAGKPGAARAVGRIMGANRIPLIIPCHRCLGRDGSLTGYSNEGGTALKARILFSEGFERDPEHARGIRHLQRRDPKLRRVIKKVGPYLAVPDKPRPPYETLVTAIVHQQLSVKAGQTIAGRVRDLVPGPGYPTPEQFLKMSDERLRECGLSRMKTSFIKDLAARVGDGRLNLNSLRKLDDEEVVTALTTVKGIGVWSAHMHLIFHLGRLDVLPVGDLGLQMAAAKLYGLEEYATAAQLTEIAEPWRPFRSLGSYYLWRGLDSGGI